MREDKKKKHEIFRDFEQRANSSLGEERERAFYKGIFERKKEKDRGETAMAGVVR